MAKLPNLWLKGGSQKLGGVVLYQANGQTLARELAPSVSNPRTDAQMSQRVKLANVVGMYRANRTWMAGAFEDKKQTESDYNAFVKANLANSLVATSKSQAAAGATVVAPYKVTSGSLPSVECVLDGTEIQTNLYLGELGITQATTVAQLSSALIDNNNGITEGMQLSIIVNLQQQSLETGIPYVVVRAYEMIISRTNSTPISTFFAGVTLVATSSDSPTLALGISTLGAGAACFILSQTSGGRTRVSTQTLVAFGTNLAYQEYTSQTAINEAVRSYGENTTVFLDSNTAQGSQAVPTANYISGLSYQSVLYQPYQRIPGGIGTTEDIYLYFNQALSGGAVPTVTITANNGQTTLAHGAVTGSSGNQRINFKLSAAYNPEYDSPIVITVLDGEEQMQFNITVGNGDIS